MKNNTKMTIIYKHNGHQNQFKLIKKIKQFMRK